MNFLVRYISDSGEVNTKTVLADSVELARTKVEVSPSQILSIEEKQKQQFNLSLGRGIKLEEQGIILTALASAAYSGQDTIEALLLLLEKRRVEYKPDVDVDTLPKHLKALKFHPLVVLVIEAGVSAGRLTESLGTAADEINRLIAQSSSLATKSRMGAIYLCMGLILFFVVPYMGNTIIAPMVAKGSVSLDGIGKLTARIHAFNSTVGFWLIPAVLVSLAFNLRAAALMLKQAPVLNVFHRWFSNRRAIQFNLAMEILLNSGYSTQVVPEKMLLVCRKGDRVIYDEMVSLVDQGFTVSELIDNHHWPDLYALAIRKFENTVKEAQLKVIGNASSMLQRNDESLSGSIANLLSLTGLSLSGFGVLMLAGGILLPMMSMSL